MQPVLVQQTCTESLFPRWALCSVNKLRSTCSVNKGNRSPTLKKCEFCVGWGEETDHKHQQIRSLPTGTRTLQATGQVMWWGGG